MTRPTNTKVAFSHLTSRVKQTLVAVLSVTFGISMYIFMNGFMTGVNDIQADLAFSTLAHIQVYNDIPEDRTDLLTNEERTTQLVNLRHPKVIQYTDGIINADEEVRTLSQFEEIAEITTQVNMNVFFHNGTNKISGALSGVNAAKEDKLFATGLLCFYAQW